MYFAKKYPFGGAVTYLDAFVGATKTTVLVHSTQSI